jgi:hypothetical protein
MCLLQALCNAQLISDAMQALGGLAMICRSQLVGEAVFHREQVHRLANKFAPTVYVFAASAVQCPIDLGCDAGVGWANDDL